MADVFISYKSERRPAARHLAKVLDAYGYDVWYDYGLLPGDDFAPRLMAEIAAARAVVVLWCTEAVSSEWVLREAREAKREGKYLPCWIESAKLPQEFASADTINLSEWDGAPRSHVLDRLIGDLARRLRRDPSMNFNRLRELHEDWRGYGSPSLRHFSLERTLTPDAPAQFQTASLGKGILGPPPADLSLNLAQHWENARQGHADALVIIAWAYCIGDGLPQDDREAARLYRLAADQGHAHAQTSLGALYMEGRGGLPQDDKAAAQLHRLAAEQGSAHAQTCLGTMYREGHGELARDDREAVRLYKLAADQGNAHGQYNLGVMYEGGRGSLPKDGKEAVRLYKLSAQQGIRRAQDRLRQLGESC